MAPVSTRQIKGRIRSMESTRQITKAMEMAASARLRRVQAELAACRPYCTALWEAAGSLECFFPPRSVRKSLHIVIAGDRGLAGGYNSALLQSAEARIEISRAAVLPIGRKALEYFRSKNYEIYKEIYLEAGKIDFTDFENLSRILLDSYRSGDFDEIMLHYTVFHSPLSQSPAAMALLPPADTGLRRDYLCEPTPRKVLDAILPDCLAGILYGALLESLACEQSARRNAMENASSNAGDMINDLHRNLNRIRQAAITQQITEIAGDSA